MKKYCIIGTGRQGTAAAYDLLKHANPKKLLLLDNNIESIANCISKLNKLNNNNIMKKRVVDINNSLELIEALEEYDIFLSSVPYRYNLALTQVAIKSKTSMVDLGGHTENVIKQLEYNQDAVKNNITIVPDCGMGPGMNVTMALYAMEQLDKPEEVRIWDGGLPLNPKPPWNYSLFFNIAGLTNEYDAHAFFLNNGKVSKVNCFEGYEELDFGNNIGKLEAVVTSGGLSTMPWTFENKLNILENKTLRYKGHWEWMRAYRELGLFSEKEIAYKGNQISPRDFYHFMLEPKLSTGDRNDICLMRIEAIGIKNNQKKKIIVDCIEKYDNQSDLMAMEKWTGWHASIMMQHIANGNIGPGAFALENALTGGEFYKEALKRNYNIVVKEKNMA